MKIEQGSLTSANFSAAYRLKGITLNKFAGVLPPSNILVGEHKVLVQRVPGVPVHKDLQAVLHSEAQEDRVRAHLGTEPVQKDFVSGSVFLLGFTERFRVIFNIFALSEDLQLLIGSCEVTVLCSLQRCW